MILKGKTVKKGKVEGEAIVSQRPFSFLGDLDVATGKVVPIGHDLEGQSIANKIFVFATGKGSTAAWPHFVCWQTTGPQKSRIGKKT